MYSINIKFPITTILAIYLSIIVTYRVNQKLSEKKKVGWIELFAETFFTLIGILLCICIILSFFGVQIIFE